MDNRGEVLNPGRKGSLRQFHEFIFKRKNVREKTKEKKVYLNKKKGKDKI